MKIYVGLDVSLKETSICVVDDDGKVLCEGTVISEPAAIAAFIKSKAAYAKRIGLETGPTSTWLWHELRALGLPVICIDARHAKAALSMQITGKPSALSSCQSQVVVGPVSRPIRFALPAFALMNAAIAGGSEITVPSHTISPSSSITQIEVSLSDTSIPT